jgi:hypothetical protein
MRKVRPDGRVEDALHIVGPGGVWIMDLPYECHYTDEHRMRSWLAGLYWKVRHTVWSAEAQQDGIAFWSGLHPTYGFRVFYRDLNKGWSVIERKGRELIERIEGGAC